MRFQIPDTGAKDGSMKTVFETERMTLYLQLPNGEHIGIGQRSDTIRIHTTSGAQIVVLPSAGNTIFVKEDK